MKQEELQKKANNLLLISRKTLEKLEPSSNNLMANIKYWRKKGELLYLKRGLYVLKERYKSESKKDEYLSYIANQIVQPSYLSAEYVMDKYQLLTEAVYAYTSMTTKKTNSFVNELGAFRYFSITPKLFTGYDVNYFYGAPVFVASKEKAVFDFLYLRFIRNQAINEKVIEELRINWIQVNRSEWEKIKSYAALSGSRKMKQLLSLIEKMFFKV